MIDRDALIARREELAGEAKKARTLADRLEGGVIALDELIAQQASALHVVDQNTSGGDAPPEPHDDPSQEAS